jgi:hypothetical protein
VAPKPLAIIVAAVRLIADVHLRDAAFSSAVKNNTTIKRPFGGILTIGSKEGGVRGNGESSVRAY